MKDIETFAHKYMTEGFLILALIIATLSSCFDFFIGAGWSVVFAALGAIVGLAFPEAIMKVQKPMFQYLKKQDRVIQIVVGVVRLIFSIFIPFVVFAEVGLLAGISYYHLPKCLFKDMHHNKEEKQEDKKHEHNKDSSNDEEHL